MKMMDVLQELAQLRHQVQWQSEQEQEHLRVLALWQSDHERSKKDNQKLTEDLKSKEMMFKQVMDQYRGYKRSMEGVEDELREEQKNLKNKD